MPNRSSVSRLGGDDSNDPLIDSPAGRIGEAAHLRPESPGVGAPCLKGLSEVRAQSDRILSSRPEDRIRYRGPNGPGIRKVSAPDDKLYLAILRLPSSWALQRSYTWTTVLLTHVWRGESMKFGWRGKMCNILHPMFFKDLMQDSSTIFART